MAAAFFLPFSSRAEPLKRPVVLELFTSQGCSSCPAADALLAELARNPSVLALSYHVDFWDHLGWKDPFSSPQNTARQKTYAQLLKDNIYTPQIVIDGKIPAVGSDRAAIQSGMEFARVSQPAIPVRIEREGDNLRITIPTAPADSGVTLPKWAAVRAVQFTRDTSATAVAAGENRGRRLESVNNVVRITLLGSWKKKEESFLLPAAGIGSDSIAVLVQTGEQGRVSGVGVYP